VDRDTDQVSVYFLFTPSTDAFAESVEEKRVELDEQQAFQDLVVWPVFRGLLIIERELAFLIVGGEVIQLGGWLVSWASDSRLVVAAVGKALALAQRYEAVAEGLAIADEMLATAKLLGRALLTALDVLWVHDVLLEMVPDLVRLERRLAEDLARLAGLRETGTVALDGWVVEDDPVERAFATRFAAAMAAVK
jgi:hypothetical protein